MQYYKQHTLAKEGSLTNAFLRRRVLPSQEKAVYNAFWASSCSNTKTSLASNGHPLRAPRPLVLITPPPGPEISSPTHDWLGYLLT